MLRRDWLLTAFPLAALAGCGLGSQRSRGDINALAERLEGLEGSPVIVFLWAPWSRSAVELESTFVELSREYEPFGVEFLAVLLEADSGPANFPVPCFFLEGPPLEALERFGVRDAPAVIALGADRTLLHRLEPADASGRLDPGDLVDLIEAAASSAKTAP